MSQLFAGQAVDGSSGEFRKYSEPMNIWVEGSLGGGTLTIEAETPNGWIPLSDGVISAEGMYVIDSGEFTGRVTLAGATGPSLSVWIDANPSP